MSILGVVRTEPTAGRGGALYSTFSYAKAPQEPALTAAGPVPADVYWERITWFLDRVVPVAEEHKVRLACHPHDPGMPPGHGYRGVHTVLGSVEGLKRFVEIRSSPYHGLNFCQGTVSEMLADPGREIYDVIRYFGSRGKIFIVHFRNIAGPLPRFPRDLHRRRRRGHAEGDARVQGGRVRRHGHARPRADRSRATPAARRPSPTPSATSRR